jgi:hypothetical protein
MQTLVMLWQPNAAWAALAMLEKTAFLRSLDDRINAGRAAGMVVLGWSAVDSSVAKSPQGPAGFFVGVFAVPDAAHVQRLEADVAASGWYRYFDSTNISVQLQGATTAEPHKIYANLLDVL